MDNVSVIAFFVLSGLNEKMSHRYILFSLALLLYCVILLVNISLIVTIILEQTLHEPMYILLCVFCINELCGTTGFYPKFLWDLLAPVHVISYSGCLIQTQVIYSSLSTELSFLAVMAYDRYVAICRPLRYHSVMSRQRLLKLVIFFWIMPFFFVGLNVSLASRLKLCSSFIARLFCANWAIVTLACFPADTVVNSIVSYVSILVYFGHGVFIVWSYTRLIKTCATCAKKRAKFRQTCVPHLMSLTMFLVTIIFDLMSLRFDSNLPQSLKNFIALEVFVIPPFMNPLIYGLRLTKIRSRLLSYINFKK